VKRVLFLSYFFPPIGGAGVQRSAKFVRYLPDEGYEPVVVTGPGAAGGRWTPADESLAGDVPPGTSVERVPGPVPAESDGWRARRERWLRAERPFSRWWVEGAVRLALAEARDVDLVYASMSPYETATAAAEIARRLRKPWVADLRDPWALDEMMVHPTAVHRRLELRRMLSALESAAAIVMNTPEAAARLRSHLPVSDRARVVTIPNGFDAADFDTPVPPRGDSSFRIVHCGYLHTELGQEHRRRRLARRLLRGQLAEVDILTRTHVYLVRALERLVRSDPRLATDVELHLAGVLSAADRLACPTVVKEHGYLPHAEAIALMRSADLLFLPMQNLPAGVRAGIVPGKTYEYLASGRPILAAVPDGDANDLLEEAGTGLRCCPDDYVAMAALIGDAIAGRRAGLASPSVHPDVVARYERRRLTADLAAVFDLVLGLESRTPSPGIVAAIA
jgi:glycosyltransferase involved in cell wall biosynthesis